MKLNMEIIYRRYIILFKLRIGSIIVFCNEKKEEIAATTYIYQLETSLNQTKFYCGENMKT